MICLVVSQSRFCVVTIILYAFVLIPLQRLKSSLVDLIGVLSFLFAPHQPLVEISGASLEPWLPVSRFVDLRNHATNLGRERERERDSEDETCSICLMEFEGEDVVSQLSKCGHVFHMKCIEKWLDCNNFTCPLCRSSFLQNANANPHAKLGVDLNPYIPSYLGFSLH